MSSTSSSNKNLDHHPSSSVVEGGAAIDDLAQGSSTREDEAGANLADAENNDGRPSVRKQHQSSGLWWPLWLLQL